jgi:hypothetical protein
MLDSETRAEALAKLKAIKARNRGDLELDHVDADAVLIDIIRYLGWDDVAEAYDDIDKWYA